MLTPAIEKMQRERANVARNIEWIKECSKEDEIDERMEMAESMYETETVEELEEASDMIEEMGEVDDTLESVAELDRIMESEEDITFDEMIGLVEL